MEHMGNGINGIIDGWLVVSTEKYEFVNWDDEIPNWMVSHNPFMFQTTNQIEIIHGIKTIDQWEFQDLQ